MTLPVRLESDAEDDLVRIQDYGLAHGFGDPEAFTETLLARIAHLGDHPRAGRAGRGSGTREWVLAGTPFVAVYRVGAGVVEVLRVLHGAQSW